MFSNHFLLQLFCQLCTYTLNELLIRQKELLRERAAGDKTVLSERWTLIN